VFGSASGTSAIQAACSSALNQITYAWNGPSGITALEGNSSNQYGIGYNTAAEYSGSTFGGVTVPAGSVVMRETYVGDTTLKGYVDFQDDFYNWLTGYTDTLNGDTNTDWQQGNFFYSPTGTDFQNDFYAWLTGYTDSLNGTWTPLASASGGGGTGGGGGGGSGAVGSVNVSATPEPATWTLLGAGMAVALLIGARRRRAAK
jgi:hypothetical protein